MLTFVNIVNIHINNFVIRKKRGIVSQFKKMTLWTALHKIEEDN